MNDYIDMQFKALADLSAKQYYLVKISTTGQVDVCAATTDKPVGILQNKPEAGEAATVRIFGRSKCNANEALAANDVVGPAADGQGAPYVAGTDTTKYSVGLCLFAAANAGEFAEVLVNPGYAKLS